MSTAVLTHEHGRAIGGGELQDRNAILDADRADCGARIERRQDRRQRVIEQVGAGLRGRSAVPVQAEGGREGEHRCAALLQHGPA